MRLQPRGQRWWLCSSCLLKRERRRWLARPGACCLLSRCAGGSGARRLQCAPAPRPSALMQQSARCRRSFGRQSSLPRSARGTRRRRCVPLPGRLRANPRTEAGGRLSHVEKRDSSLDREPSWVHRRAPRPGSALRPARGAAALLPSAALRPDECEAGAGCAAASVGTGAGEAPSRGASWVACGR